MNDNQADPAETGSRLTGHGWFTGGGSPPPGFVPWFTTWEGRERHDWVLWTDDQWDSWSDAKREAMYELWDEICYLSGRDTRPGNAEKLAYCLSMLDLALAS
jgi:hypothetical protein